MVGFSELLVDWCDTLAAVLAHSLWQGLLISVAVWAVLRTVPSRYTNLRYVTAVGGLATFVLAVFVTWAVLQLPARSRKTDRIGSVTDEVANQLASNPSALAAAPANWGPWRSGGRLVSSVSRVCDCGAAGSRSVRRD